MTSDSGARLDDINIAVAKFLFDAQRSLSGQANFGLAEVRALAAVVAEMQPFTNLSHPIDPQLSASIRLYKDNLTQLQTVLRSVRVNLTAQKAALELHRSQLFAASRWTTAMSANS